MEQVLSKTNRRWNQLCVIIGFIIIGLIIASRIDTESCDIYFMVKHGEDILQNGFFRKYDIFSMHPDLQFMSQKWLSCIVVYWLYNVAGIHAIRVASCILTLGLFSLMYVTLNKMSPNTTNVNILFIAIVGYGMLNDTVLRPHLIAAYFLMFELICLERYVRGLLTCKTLYISMSIVSLCIMWFHSTMWYMCIIFIIPYLLDVKYIVDGIKVNNYPVIKHVKHVSYNKKPLLVCVCLMLFASLLQPYGLLQYKYMFICLTASGEKYCHISELHALAPLSIMAICMYIILAIMLYLSVKYKVVRLRCFYMTLGGVLMSGIAVRLFFFSVLLWIVAIGNLLSDCITDEVQSKFRKKRVYIMTIVTNLSVMTICVITVAITGYVTITGNFTETYNNLRGITAIDTLTRNVEDIDSLKIYTDADVGSYLIVSNGHPYIDCRAEVYDIKLNGSNDVLNEYHNLLLGYYEGKPINDENVVHQFQDKYDFDYYVLSKNMMESELNIRYMYKILSDELYCNYEDEYYAIYSANDVRTFE